MTGQNLLISSPQHPDARIGWIERPLRDPEWLAPNKTDDDDPKNHRAYHPDRSRVLDYDLSAVLLSLGVSFPRYVYTATLHPSEQPVDVDS